MFIKKLVIGLLSFYAVEIKRSSLRSEDISSFDLFSSTSIEKSIGVEKKKRRESERKQTKLYDNRKWSKRRTYKEKSLKLQGSHSKDARYSNQMKLRRMYRNS